ncbi:hypothetical protein L1F30_10800 [Simiduia sp. 21SJ11W-1]|uniref:hypothetical protein n=1 Tax=Simiduia sp. 21SJ11W-1 TaxID=2909669 RepID=UPI00209D184F|nr:hypothetical protein [Simiduia sp. 21SJ11W-1]UTA46651.1 hypothetical protein L1F30_10800 [Simiduia sp. 21SJ11W-1]
MTASLLYLNDVQVQLVSQGEPLVCEPAQLVFEGTQVLSGEQALARLRITPLAAYNQHWAQLHQQPLKLPNPDYRHHADLAYWQLNRWLAPLAQGTPLLVAPSYRYQAQQYSLLAGMLQAAGAEPAGFIHAALLHTLGALTQGLGKGPFLHLDLCLHQAHITELRVHNGQLVIQQEWDFPELGLNKIKEAWLQKVARLCIDQTRYDPLHSAESEQRLFNQWADCIAQLQKGPAAGLDIDGHEIEIQHRDVSDLYRALHTKLQSLQGQVLLTPIARALPGLEGYALDKNLLATAVDQLPQGLINSGSIQLLQSLPVSNLQGFAGGTQQEANTRESLNHTSPVTHLLVNHRAHRLQPGLALTASGELTSSPAGPITARFEYRAPHWHCVGEGALKINGEAIENTHPLKLGDQLHTGQQKATCIHVSGSEHGA